MMQLKINKEFYEFLLRYAFPMENVCGHGNFNDATWEDIKMMIETAADIAEKHFWPASLDADRIGAQLRDGKVTLPESCIVAHKEYVKNGFLNIATEDGMGLPPFLERILDTIFATGSIELLLSFLLTKGARDLLCEFGDSANPVITYAIKSMSEGRMTGTMAITEAGSGSYVPDLKTRAEENPDQENFPGTYVITGMKTFISEGGQNYTENTGPGNGVGHMVLGKIPGAPEGAKGISLFFVPTFVSDGTDVWENNTKILRIEEKIAMHGSATCVLEFENSVAYLVGTKNKGLEHMFRLMNKARLGVGDHGTALSLTAYDLAVRYAKERIQGVRAEDARKPDAKRVAIIEHPDVRRMLTEMGAYAFGIEALLCHVYYMQDIAEITKDTNTKKAETIQQMVDMLVSVCKAYATDVSEHVTSLGVQTAGGYGYTEDYPFSGLWRRSKIGQIYEGTNGIQALNLMTRSFAKYPHIFFMIMDTAINNCQKHRTDKGLGKVSQKVKHACMVLCETAISIGYMTGKEQGEALENIAESFPNMRELSPAGEGLKKKFSDGSKKQIPIAYPCTFLHMFGHCLTANMHLHMMTEAQKLLDAMGPEKAKSAVDPWAKMLRNELRFGNYFINNILSQVGAMAETFNNADTSPLEMEF